MNKDLARISPNWREKKTAISDFNISPESRQTGETGIVDSSSNAHGHFHGHLVHEGIYTRCLYVNHD